MNGITNRDGKIDYDSDLVFELNVMVVKTAIYMLILHFCQSACRLVSGTDAHPHRIVFVAFERYIVFQNCISLLRRMILYAQCTTSTQRRLSAIVYAGYEDEKSVVSLKLKC